MGSRITAPLPEGFRTPCAPTGLALLVVFTLLLIAAGVLVAAGP